MDTVSRAQLAASRRQSSPFSQNPHQLLYPDLVSWQNPTPLSCSTAASALRYHSSSSFSSQRMLPASPALNSPNSADYVNHEGPQSTWPAHYLRPGWGNAFVDDSYTLKSASNYPDVAFAPSGQPSTAARPNPSTDPGVLHHQHHVYTPITHEHENTMSSVVASVAHEEPFSVPVVSPLYPKHSDVLQMNHPDPLLLQPPQIPSLQMNWSAVPNQELTNTQQNAILTSQPSYGGLTTGSMAHNNPALAASPWGIVSNSSTMASTAFAPAGELVFVDATGAQVPFRPPFVLPEPPVQLQVQPPGSMHVETNSRKRKSVSKSKLPAQRAPKTKLSRRQGKLSEEGRANAAAVRKLGPCTRCKLYHVRCDRGEPCKTCMKSADGARLFKAPCFRVNVETLSLVRHCNGRFNQPDVYFLSYHWKEDGGAQIMDLMWNLPGYGPMSNTPPIQIGFRAYHPENLQILDSTRNYWQTCEGPVVTVDQPAYAVYDTADLMANVERYLRRNQPSIEHWILDRIQNDPIALLTYKEAIRQRDQRGSILLERALQMQCGAILSQGYGTVWTPHVPGIKEYDFRLFGHSGYEAYDRNGRDRPLPTAIAHQMDVAILKHIDSLQKPIRTLLRKAFFSSGNKAWYSWYEIFLTLFVVLFNMQYIHGSAKRYMNVKRNTLLEVQVNYIVRSQLEEWEHGAKALLYVFGAVLRGYRPLKEARDNIEELSGQPCLDQEAVQYLSTLASILEKGNCFAPKASTRIDTEWDSSANTWIQDLLDIVYEEKH